MESKYNLTITVKKDCKNPEKLILMDILGSEYENFYDGCGFSFTTEEKDFFFHSVSQNLIDLVPIKLINHPSIKYRTRQVV